jgi:hypothetical protein
MMLANDIIHEFPQRRRIPAAVGTFVGLNRPFQLSKHRSHGDIRLNTRFPERWMAVTKVTRYGFS